MIEGGSAYNIIPYKIKTNGTIRAFNSDIRETISKRMEEIASNICKAYNINCDYIYSPGVPVTINDKGLTDFIIKTISREISPDVLKTVIPTTGGEDFSLFSQKIPGTFMLLGTKNEKKGIIGALHQPDYNIDNNILTLGVKSFLHIILNYLRC